jgi:hypothetical protein
VGAAPAAPEVLLLPHKQVVMEVRDYLPLFLEHQLPMLAAVVVLVELWDLEVLVEEEMLVVILQVLPELQILAAAVVAIMDHQLLLQVALVVQVSLLFHILYNFYLFFYEIY